MTAVRLIAPASDQVAVNSAPDAVHVAIPAASRPPLRVSMPEQAAKPVAVSSPVEIRITVR